MGLLSFSLLNKTYLHKFKMAAIDHPEFQTFTIIHIESNVIPNL